MAKLFLGLASLPFIASMAMAGQPVALSDTQMDKVTAGANETPVGIVHSTVTIPGIGSITITYGIFAVCATCDPNAALANAALATLLPPNP
jgi:hypothetical protein